MIFRPLINSEAFPKFHSALGTEVDRGGDDRGPKRRQEDAGRQVGPANVDVSQTRQGCERRGERGVAFKEFFAVDQPQALEADQKWKRLE